MTARGLLLLASLLALEIVGAAKDYDLLVWIGICGMLALYGWYLWRDANVRRLMLPMLTEGWLFLSIAPGLAIVGGRKESALLSGIALFICFAVVARNSFCVADFRRRMTPLWWLLVAVTPALAIVGIVQESYLLCLIGVFGYLAIVGWHTIDDNTRRLMIGEGLLLMFLSWALLLAGIVQKSDFLIWVGLGGCFAIVGWRWRDIVIRKRRSESQ